MIGKNTTEAPLLQSYLSKKARGIMPYTAGAQPQGNGIIKLNTNENPYPPSPATLDALERFDGARLRLYPRPDGGPLRTAAAQVFSLPESHVFCGNGSDEVLGLAFDAFFDGNIVFPDITYSFYPVWAEYYGISFSTVPLNNDFTVPADRMVGIGGVVIANPNAPTGIALSLADIEHILQLNEDRVVIVDEAYVAFGAQSAVPLIEKYPNLLVVMTMSKSHALAGLRVGLALGQPHLIDGLTRIKDSFNSYPVDMMAQHVAAAALLDEDYYAAISRRIIATRDNTVRALTALGLSVLPSSANFLFATWPGISAAQLKAHLEKSRIYVRHFNLTRISEYLRITIGTDEQMDALLRCIGEFKP
jgi:histidinol-phosphate aminotransferase